ncbi:hypothetical protein AAHN93_09710 [Vandammella animalimorsus]|uniref:DUF7822 domain-containing protein n=1 Tax=Vandammella animalimorsus TaxID=2029117 RepID=UPI0031BA72B8
MANRSYLYAIDFDRTQGERRAGGKIYGLGEYGHSIPLAYKILVSQNSRLAHSIIWEYPHPIAIQGDFEPGRQKLLDFLKQLAEENIFEPAELQRRIQETETFLEKNRLQYAILECGEIYELGSTALEVRNRELFEREILNIDEHLAGCLAELGDMKRAVEQLEADARSSQSFFSRLLGRRNKSQMEQAKAKILRQAMWNMLGINGWSNILYYDFDNE